MGTTKIVKLIFFSYANTLLNKTCSWFNKYPANLTKQPLKLHLILSYFKLKISFYIYFQSIFNFSDVLWFLILLFEFPITFPPKILCNIPNNYKTMDISLLISHFLGINLSWRITYRILPSLIYHPISVLPQFPPPPPSINPISNI